MHSYIHTYIHCQIFQVVIQCIEFVSYVISEDEEFDKAKIIISSLQLLQLLTTLPKQVYTRVCVCLCVYVCPSVLLSVCLSVCVIREYGSTLYVGMAPKKNGHPYISIATNELKSLLIYTDRFKYTHTF